MFSGLYFGPYNRTTSIRGPELAGSDDAPQYASVPFCVDLKGKTIPPGYHFVPGPDQCFVCICDRGSPKWCQAVLCAPPQDCKSFRVVGSSCCDFECLDKTLQDGGSIHNGPESAAELGSHLVAWTVSVVLSMSLIYFLFRRLRKKRHLSVLRRVFLNQDIPSEGNPGFATSAPFPYLEAFGNGVDGQTFACIPTPGGGLALASAANEVVRLPGGAVRSVCAVWKPDDLPPPYSEVAGADEDAVETGGAAANANAAAGPSSPGPAVRPSAGSNGTRGGGVVSPPTVTIVDDDDEEGYDGDVGYEDEDAEQGTSTRESEIGDACCADDESGVVEARNDVVGGGGGCRRADSRVDDGHGERVELASLSSCASLPSSACEDARSVV